MGANFGNFPTGSNFIFAIGFQVCLGSILGLFVFYWLKLNMMQTLGYLAILAIPSLFFVYALQITLYKPIVNLITVLRYIIMSRDYFLIYIQKDVMDENTTFSFKYRYPGCPL